MEIKDKSIDKIDKRQSIDKIDKKKLYLVHKHDEKANTLEM